MSNVFDISKKTDLTLRGGSQTNASNILCAIAGNLLMQESDGRKPDYFGLVVPLSKEHKFHWKFFSQIFFQKLVKEKLVGSY